MTAVLDVDTTRIVWLGRGRGLDALGGFFTALGTARCAQRTAVALDMWAASTSQVTHVAPQAALVYDPFHVLARYHDVVVDRMRVTETNTIAKSDRTRPAVTAARRVIKGMTWLLLENAGNLRDDAHVRVDERLRANRALATVYTSRTT